MGGNRGGEDEEKKENKELSLGERRKKGKGEEVRMGGGGMKGKADNVGENARKCNKQI